MARRSRREIDPEASTIPKKTGVVEVRGETSNRNPRVGLAGGNVQTEMVGPAGLEPATRPL